MRWRGFKKPKIKAKNMSKQLDYFVHHVYFWLKKPVTSETRLKFENGLKKLVTIETIIGKHLGTPATTDRGVIDSTYSYSLLLTFKNKEDQDIYQTHPTHLKFIDECEELWERVLVYDSVKIT
jgi:hypothetical protein